MAIQVLGSSTNSNGTEECDWQIDYDSTSQTIGHTCTGQASSLILSVTIVATQQTFHKDVTADLNKGRIVDFTGIPANQVPQPVKGQQYPVTFSDAWTP